MRSKLAWQCGPVGLDLFGRQHRFVSTMHVTLQKEPEVVVDMVAEAEAEAEIK